MNFGVTKSNWPHSRSQTMKISRRSFLKLQAMVLRSHGSERPTVRGQMA